MPEPPAAKPGEHESIFSAIGRGRPTWGSRRQAVRWRCFAAGNNFPRGRPTWGSRRQAGRWRRFAAGNKFPAAGQPGARAARLYDGAASRLGTTSPAAGQPGLAPPGCTMAPRARPPSASEQNRLFGVAGMPCSFRQRVGAHEREFLVSPQAFQRTVVPRLLGQVIVVASHRVASRSKVSSASAAGKVGFRRKAPAASRRFSRRTGHLGSSAGMRSWHDLSGSNPRLKMTSGARQYSQRCPALRATSA